MKAIRQNTKASFFQVYYKGCHEKVWPRFRVSLQTSNDSIKKTALQVGPDTWVFNYLFLVVNWPRSENNYKWSWQPKTAITLTTLKEDRCTEERPTARHKSRGAKLQAEDFQPSPGTWKRQDMRERHPTLNTYWPSNFQTYMKTNFCNYKLPNCDPMFCAVRILNSHNVLLKRTYN